METERVQRLAREFSRQLRIDLDPEKMAEVIRRNNDMVKAGYSPDKVCATHDFCDANMVMDKAMHNTGDLGAAVYLNTELWNAAWLDAKTHDFYPPKHAIVVIDGGMAEVKDNFLPEGYSVVLVDLDCLRDGDNLGDEWDRLSDAAQDYVRRTDADLAERAERESDRNDQHRYGVTKH